MSATILEALQSIRPDVTQFENFQVIDGRLCAKISDAEYCLIEASNTTPLQYECNKIDKRPDNLLQRFTGKTGEKKQWDEFLAQNNQFSNSLRDEIDAIKTRLEMQCNALQNPINNNSVETISDLAQKTFDITREIYKTLIGDGDRIKASRETLQAIIKGETINNDLFTAASSHSPTVELGQYPPHPGPTERAYLHINDTTYIIDNNGCVWNLTELAKETNPLNIPVDAITAIKQLLTDKFANNTRGSDYLLKAKSICDTILTSEHTPEDLKIATKDLIDTMFNYENGSSVFKTAITIAPYSKYLRILNGTKFQTLIKTEDQIYAAEELPSLLEEALNACNQTKAQAYIEHVKHLLIHWPQLSTNRSDKEVLALQNVHVAIETWDHLKKQGADYSVEFNEIRSELYNAIPYIHSSLFKQEPLTPSVDKRPEVSERRYVFAQEQAPFAEKILIIENTSEKDIYTPETLCDIIKDTDNDEATKANALAHFNRLLESIPNTSWGPISETAKNNCLSIAVELQSLLSNTTPEDEGLKAEIDALNATLINYLPCLENVDFITALQCIAGPEHSGNLFDGLTFEVAQTFWIYANATAPYALIVSNTTSGKHLLLKLHEENEQSICRIHEGSELKTPGSLGRTYSWDKTTGTFDGKTANKPFEDIIFNAEVRRQKETSLYAIDEATSLDHTADLVQNVLQKSFDAHADKLKTHLENGGAISATTLKTLGGFIETFGPHISHDRVFDSIKEFLDNLNKNKQSTPIYENDDKNSCSYLITASENKSEDPVYFYMSHINGKITETSAIALENETVIYINPSEPTRIQWSQSEISFNDNQASPSNDNTMYYLLDGETYCRDLNNNYSKLEYDAAKQCIERRPLNATEDELIINDLINLETKNNDDLSHTSELKNKLAIMQRVDRINAFNDKDLGQGKGIRKYEESTLGDYIRELLPTDAEQTYAIAFLDDVNIDNGKRESIVVIYNPNIQEDQYAFRFFENNQGEWQLAYLDNSSCFTYKTNSEYQIEQNGHIFSFNANRPTLTNNEEIIERIKINLKAFQESHIDLNTIKSSSSSRIERKLKDIDDNVQTIADEINALTSEYEKSKNITFENISAWADHKIDKLDEDILNLESELNTLRTLREEILSKINAPNLSDEKRNRYTEVHTRTINLIEIILAELNSLKSFEIQISERISQYEQGKNKAFEPEFPMPAKLKNSKASDEPATNEEQSDNIDEEIETIDQLFKNNSDNGTEKTVTFDLLDSSAELKADATFVITEKDNPSSALLTKFDIDVNDTNKLRKSEEKTAKVLKATMDPNALFSVRGNLPIAMEYLFALAAEGVTNSFIMPHIPESCKNGKKSSFSNFYDIEINCNKLKKRIDTRRESYNDIYDSGALQMHRVIFNAVLENSHLKTCIMEAIKNGDLSTKKITVHDFISIIARYTLTNTHTQQNMTSEHESGVHIEKINQDSSFFNTDVHTISSIDKPPGSTGPR